ncbi:hypothetical protein C3469_26035 [Mycobacterium kansasii]|nr:hypothetical protein C3B43_27760 [Mycobacterium kansasii]POX94836.1 hypothetical protein C3477_26640 [Mycobacterium kansasii]POX99659.1 hypothetical protein C3479_18405 [Mycobacterium kansasii]POY12152.1 hypothetical protein C3476_28035 [Mycobacterium kansasii]POY19633.1 hypothetical protein C3469_26035 [Mycobacterium kansasii]
MRAGSSRNDLTEVTTFPPTTGQWTPTHPRQPGTGSRVWHTVGLAIAIVLGAATQKVLSAATYQEGPSDRVCCTIG